MFMVLSGVFAGGTSLPDVIWEWGVTVRTSPDSANSQHCNLTCTIDQHSELISSSVHVASASSPPRSLVKPDR